MEPRPKLDHDITKAWFPYRCICRVCRKKKIHRTHRIHSISYNKLYLSFLLYWAFVREVSIKFYRSYEFFSYDRHDRYDDMETRLHRTDRIHSISYKKLYLWFLLYWAFVREVSIKLYLSYEFFSYDRHDIYDRYNDMEIKARTKKKITTLYLIHCCGWRRRWWRRSYGKKDSNYKFLIFF